MRKKKSYNHGNKCYSQMIHVQVSDTLEYVKDIEIRCLQNRYK